MTDGDETQHAQRDAELAELVTALGRLGRTKFIAALGRIPLTSGGRIERRDCYRQISKVAGDIYLRALDAAEWGGGPLGSCSIPFTGQEVMDAVLLRTELRALVRVLKSRQSWPMVDAPSNWLAVAKGAADLSMHADRMGLAATSFEDITASTGEWGIW